MEYVTFEAREATFAPPSKRSKTGGWPHKAPKPANLARAGFYYKPSAQSNDNVVCFMCTRNLDGWEPEDDPIQEHLKHADGCGWALLMSIDSQTKFDASEMADPTSEQYVDARRATFASGWPHESKRGWTCKVDKMVEAGWHFVPTSESEDYVSCVYCKLSLDGWEPKDNPFEEHYSRSPECPFFIFAGTTAPSKRPKAKKGRVSRTSKVSRTSRASTRLSTQSNLTFLSDSNDIPNLEESLDTSNISLLSTASTATTKTTGKRKATGGRTKAIKPKKAKTTKSKKEPEPESQSEPEPEREIDEVVIEEQAEDVAYPSLKVAPVLELESANIEVHYESPKPGESQPDQEPLLEALSPVQSLGPPEREASVIPVLASSPIPTIKASPQSATPISATTQRQQRVSNHVSTRSPPQSPNASTSDIENAPPSTRRESARPPVSSPGGTTPPKWTPVDIEMIFDSSTAAELFQSVKDENQLSDSERQMTVQDWVKFIAGKAEENLRLEGERVVGIFEREGQRALTVLEGIKCV